MQFFFDAFLPNQIVVNIKNELFSFGHNFFYIFFIFLFFICCNFCPFNNYAFIFHQNWYTTSLLYFQTAIPTYQNLQQPVIICFILTVLNNSKVARFYYNYFIFNLFLNILQKKCDKVLINLITSNPDSKRSPTVAVYTNTKREVDIHLCASGGGVWTNRFCAILRSVSGHLISLSSVFTIDAKLGRCVLSFCQLSNISW